MCGRYTLLTDIFKIMAYFDVDRTLEETPGEPSQWKLRFNAAPGQELPVVVEARDKGRELHGELRRELRWMKWGLIPSWAKDPSVGYKMINARSESAAEKPSFKQALSRRRCLVPVDGFYEWKLDGKKKTPMRILRKDRAPFGFAGLWDTWKSPEGKQVESFTILTTEARGFIRQIHERMPLVLAKSEFERWLNVESGSTAAIEDLLVPREPEGIEAYPVSTIVNVAKNDVPECIVPVEEEVAPHVPEIGEQGSLF